ncbi:MAG: hypothetical protein IJX92_04065 [Clostridia bacterium]|nr:hypothetical protein [Clostridia bacterium]
MYSVGENILYGSGGVMRVVDVREENITGEKKNYYVLRAVGAHEDSLTYVPVDNEKLTSMMYPLMTKGEIDALLKRVACEDEEEWLADSRQRGESFKRIMDSGDRVKLMRMIRSIHSAAKKRSLEGKKNYLSDENAMRKAKKLLYSEFSVVLGIPEDDVEDFITREIEKNK